MFKLLTVQNSARRGRLITVDGSIETPAFMNVATSGAIKGGISALDLKELKCQIMLSNTYHLHVRPGESVISGLGGLKNFTGWRGPTLTDSGGFQVFSLASLRKIKEEGVTFQSHAHVDGRKIMMGPEESMRIQSSLGSTIAMAFDECVANPSSHSYAMSSADRTTRWLHRCILELKRLNQSSDTINPKQMLFGINQGSVYPDIRVRHMQEIAELDLDGYAIGGLAVGEEASVMYKIIDHVAPEMPKNKIRYLMGVGTPANILEAVWRGIDLFDCVMPSRNARHGHIFTWNGIININNAKYISDSAPLDTTCGCPTCCNFSRAYIRHLLRSKEMLGMRLAVMHNLYFYNTLMERIRSHIELQTFENFYHAFSKTLATRI
jgi:queuine tRNA-ribosyltransferase